MSFKLWTPGRALRDNQKIFPPLACTHCKGTGEQDHKYTPACGHSYIPCEYCRATGKKVLVDAGTDT